MEKSTEPLLSDSKRIWRSGMSATSASGRRVLFFATLGAFIVFGFYLHSKYSTQIYKDVELSTVRPTAPTPPPQSLGLCTPTVLSNGQIQVEKAVCAQSRVSMEELRAANSDPLPSAQFTAEQQSSFCSGDGTDCVAEFRHMSADHDFVYAERDTRTLICTMPKNLSVLLGGLFCLLHDPIGYLYGSLDMFQQAFLSPRCHKRLYDQMDTAIEKHNATMERDWDYLTVVREPVDRFISAFLYTCIHGAAAQAETKCIHFCYNCGYNFTCYVERSYDRLMSLSKGEDTAMSFELHHLYPQTWQIITSEKMSQSTDSSCSGKTTPTADFGISNEKPTPPFDFAALLAALPKGSTTLASRPPPESAGTYAETTAKRKQTARQQPTDASVGERRQAKKAVRRQANGTQQ